MSEHDRLINFCFTEPGPLVPGGEDLYSNILSSPLAPPHLSKSTLPNGLLQDNSSSYGSLDQQWQPCKTNKKKDISTSRSMSSGEHVCFLLLQITDEGVLHIVNHTTIKPEECMILLASLHYSAVEFNPE